MALIDPSIIISRRGQRWLERAERDCPGAVTVPATLRTLEPPLWNAFASAYFYRQPVDEGQEWLSMHPGVLATDHEHATHDIAGLVDEVVGCVRSGMVLVARRRELLDLIVAAEYPMVLEGRRSYADALSAVVESLGGALAGALARRARFTLRLARAADSDAPHLALGDQGPARY